MTARSFSRFLIMDPSRFRVIGADSQTEPIPVTTVIKPLTEPEPEVVDIPLVNPLVHSLLVGGGAPAINVQETSSCLMSANGMIWNGSALVPVQQFVNSPMVIIDEVDSPEEPEDNSKYDTMFGDWEDRETRKCESFSAEIDTGQTSVKSSAFSSTSTKSTPMLSSSKVQRRVQTALADALQVKWASKLKSILRIGNDTGEPPVQFGTSK